MKFVFYLMILFPSLSLGSALEGIWVRCDSEESGFHFEHYLQFEKNNVEFELIAAYKASITPCSGDVAFAFGSNWHYLDEGNTLKSTLFTTRASALTKYGAKFLSTTKFCGGRDWRVEERVECTSSSKDSYYRIGHQTTHQYFIKGDELHTIDRHGETLIFKRYQE